MDTALVFKFQNQITKLEQQIFELKKNCFGFAKKIISLQGILKGVKINEKDIAQAKKSLFRRIDV